MGTYQLVSTTHLCGNYWFKPLRTNVYFAGKLVHFKNFTTANEDAVVLDRLGSVVRGENVSGSLTSYYPYGEQKGADNLLPEKFATYLRDSIYTKLDYAHNRYYSSTLGRFTTSDPNGIMNLSNPGSLNRYAYVAGDPINRNDPSGLDSIPVDPGDTGAVFGNCTWETVTGAEGNVVGYQYVCMAGPPGLGYGGTVKVPEHKKRPNPYPCSLMAGRAQRYV